MVSVGERKSAKQVVVSVSYGFAFLELRWWEMQW